MSWFVLREPDPLPTPSLLVYPDRVSANIDRAVALAGSPQRLRPHVKTHKSADVTRLHLERGITRFKCATIAEARMLAEAGAKEVLLAYQPVGPAMDQLILLARAHRGVRFGCLADDPATVDVLDVLAERHGATVSVFVDLDVGMHRTGVSSGPGADALYERIHEARWVDAGGIHAYDGHSTATNPDERERQAAEARGRALEMRAGLQDRGLPVSELIVSGTPPFPMHARAVHAMDAKSADGISLSPGTYSYHDWGYAESFPDLPFEAAALVMGRVISVPWPGRFTIDVGSKAIAADSSKRRGSMLSHPEAHPARQSEEHWEWEIPAELTPLLGTVVYVWPRHICPSVEHYDRAAVVDSGGVHIGWWEVTARGR